MTTWFVRGRRPGPSVGRVSWRYPVSDDTTDPAL